MCTDKIGFNNFKAFGEEMQTFSKKPITLVYGPNSIGKSSLLQSQLLLNSRVHSYDFSIINEYFAGDKFDIENFKNYVHKHDIDKKITYEIRLNQKESILAFFSTSKEMNNEIIELYDNNFFDQKITDEQIRKKLNSDYMNARTKPNREDDYLEKFIRLSNSVETERILQNFEFYQHLLNTDEIKIILSISKEENGEIAEVYIANKPYNINFLFDNIIKPAQHFGPLRPYPKRKDMLQFSGEKNKNSFNDIIKDTNYLKTFKRHREILSKYRLSPLLLLHPKHFRFFYQIGAFNIFLPENKKQVFNDSATAHQLWLELINNKGLQAKLSAWLSDKHKLKSAYEIRVDRTKVNYMDTIRWWDKDILNRKTKDPISKAIHLIDDVIEKVLIKIFKRPPSYLNELKFIDTRTDTEVTPRDMGLGISQVLPILISTFTSKEKSLYLEQPELHLHPAVQMEVMDEFIRSAKENNNNNEFMIETHSEHLLLRIMKRMRHTAEDKQGRNKSLDLTPDDVCLLYVDSDNESTFIKELRLSPKGKLLDHWPNGFFEEGFKERFS